ncbi:MAG: hypothetical protein WKF76_04020 [Nocardioidaceae bacterium]
MAWLVQRYAVIASRPEGEIRKVRGLLVDMALEGALEGAAIGLLGPAVWLLVGRDRRRQLVSRLSWRSAAIGAVLVVVVASAVVFEPWDNPATPGTVEPDPDASWQSIAELVPETDIPAEAQPLQVQTGLITSSTKSLIQSAFDTYHGSIEFYRTTADNAAGVSGELRQPGSDETVAILVSDRHDNVGMDLVVRRLADTAGATVLLDAGDDTSTGEPWRRSAWTRSEKPSRTTRSTPPPATMTKVRSCRTTWTTSASPCSPAPRWTAWTASAYWETPTRAAAVSAAGGQRSRPR